MWPFFRVPEALMASRRAPIRSMTPPSAVQGSLSVNDQLSLSDGGSMARTELHPP
jgi:hypothetical protein